MMTTKTMAWYDANSLCVCMDMAILWVLKYPPQSKNMEFGLISDSKLMVSLNVSVNCCLSLRIPVLDRQPLHGAPRLLLIGWDRLPTPKIKHIRLINGWCDDILEIVSEAINAHKFQAETFLVHISTSNTRSNNNKVQIYILINWCSVFRGRL